MVKQKLSLIMGLAITATCLGTLSFSIPSTKADVPPDLTNSALQKLAQSTGIPITRLKVVNSTQFEYPLQGKSTTKFKIIDKRSGEIYSISLDSQGQELNSLQLQNQELTIQKARNGKLAPALNDKLSNLSSDRSVKVAIWLKEANFTPQPRPPANVKTSPLTSLQALKQAEQERTTAIKPLINSASNKLKNLGFQVKADQNAPVIYANLTPSRIQQVAKLREVDQIYEDKQLQPTLDVARATIFANIPQSQGFTGAGIKVGEIEVGGRINTANPYLAGTVQDLTFSCNNSHADAVAGMIRSTHPTIRGIAPGASLWVGGSCGGWSSELQDRTNAASNWGAQVFNLSLGGDSGRRVDSFARFYDDLVMNRSRTVVIAAGNSGNGGNVGTPAVAYNVIAVGSFDDRNTTSWLDDLISSFSSGADPISTNGDREKPEISAPGSNIKSTIRVSPWVGSTGSGTSYAAPMITGIVAQMMQANSSLTSWPEAVKAILMTTAVHNIEGSARLSELDGAGGAASDRAVNLARNIGGRWGGQSYSCSTATNVDVATFSLTGGVRTRATIAWNNNPSYVNYANQPSADLDLQIVNSAGTVVSSSASWDNTYEIVDFTPSTSGTYKLRVQKHRCDLTPNWLGWAWRQGS
jgi:hypothetical protein